MSPACPVKCCRLIFLKLEQILHDNFLGRSQKFGNILTTFIDVMPVVSILNFHMRRQKLYDFDGFDVRPSLAQPATWNG